MEVENMAVDYGDESEDEDEYDVAWLAVPRPDPRPRPKRTHNLDVWRLVDDAVDMEWVGTKVSWQLGVHGRWYVGRLVPYRWYLGDAEDPRRYQKLTVEYYTREGINWVTLQRKRLWLGSVHGPALPTKRLRARVAKWRAAYDLEERRSLRARLLIVLRGKLNMDDLFFRYACAFL